jgi:hypothetical protein
VNTKEEDPDTLQLLDELNTDWVKAWCKIVNKMKSAATGLTFIVPPLEKVEEEPSART